MLVVVQPSVQDTNHPVHSRAAHGVSAKAFEEKMTELGVDASKAVATMKLHPVKKRGRSLTRRGEESSEEEEAGMDEAGEVCGASPCCVRLCACRSVDACRHVHLCVWLLSPGLRWMGERGCVCAGLKQHRGVSVACGCLCGRRCVCRSEAASALLLVARRAPRRRVLASGP
jgi:hypothetical protein